MKQLQLQLSSFRKNKQASAQRLKSQNRLLSICRLFLGPVRVNGAHGLRSVRAALGLLALLVGLVDGDRVPGGGVGHALLLGGDLALLGGVGLGEAGLGGGALYDLLGAFCGFCWDCLVAKLTDSVLLSSA